MRWHTSLDQLVAALADLYDREDLARIVAQGVGLNLARISFDGRMLTTWHAIVEEAVKQDKLVELIERARTEYPQYASLQTAQAAYLTWRQEPAEEPPPAPGPRIYRLTNQQKWQLVDALLKCPSVRNRQRRNAVVENLRDNIKDNAERDDSARLDVYNIVSTALSYAGGVQELVEAVRNFDADTEEMADVDRVLASFG
jgi:hypothetical protein